LNDIIIQGKSWDTFATFQALPFT